MKRATRILALVAANAAVFGLIEGGVRLAEALGILALTPGGAAGFDILQQGAAPPVERRLYVQDRHLLLRMRPEFEETYPRLFVQRDGRRTYQVRTNAQGFRTPPFSESKRPRVIRVACLGDSSTFGMNVEEADSYPRQLAALLEAAEPGRFEVLNLGVPGYSTRQGLELLRREVLALEPDVVTFAFGTNDRSWTRPITDDEAIRFNQTVLGGAMFTLRGALDRLHVYRLLRNLFKRFVQLDYDLVVEGDKRSTPENVRDNVVQAGAALRPLGASLLVLDSDFFGTDVSELLREAAAQADVPLLDLPGAFQEVRRARSLRFEAAHALGPGRPRPGTVLLRVHAPGEARVFVRVGRYSNAAHWLPMRDDGVSPDQIAGDGVWSASIPTRGSGPLYYLYGRGDLPDPEPEFRANSFLPDTSRHAPAFARSAPLDEFGAGSLMSDETHPDEEGHAVIARRLAREILSLERVRAGL